MRRDREQAAESLSALSWVQPGCAFVMAISITIISDNYATSDRAAGGKKAQAGNMSELRAR